MIAVGLGLGLFLVANSGWVRVDVPPWLEGIFGNRQADMWLPALIGGWLASILLTGLLIIWSMFYVWRRRQYESLIHRLERELAQLRNLPFTEPAPLEDLPESPDPTLARALAAAVDDEDAA